MAKVLTAADVIGKAEHVSASQLSMLFQCEQKFAFRYGERLPEVRGGNLSLGTAVDEAAELFNLKKLETHENTLPLKDVVDFSVASLEKQKDETAWDPDDPFLGIKDRLPAMIQTLYEGSLIRYQPAAVQEELRVEFENWHLLGYSDMRDVDGVTRDYKSTRRSWSKGRENQEVQPVIYTMHYDGASTFEWDIVVRLKDEVKIQQPRRVVMPAMKAGMKQMTAQAKFRMDQLRLDPQRALPTGYGSMLCSRKYCPFWQACEARWHQPIRGGDDG